MTDAREFVRMVREYKPNGDETLVGYCTHAGDQIRILLTQFIMDPNLRFANVSSPILQVVGHDTTLIFDIETQNWAVINSKSPIKLLNLTPFERLHEIGRPYVTNQQ